jgi:NADPH:quinone reductase-like Zn-dependent oxidoreductase
MLRRIMRAAVMSTPDSVPTCAEFPDPPLADGRQQVRLVAAGLHPVVRALAGGGHYASRASWPIVPGVDAVAVDTTGRLVYTGFAEHPFGTFAERISVPSVLPLPAHADPVQVAAALNPGMSSWLPLRAAQDAGGVPEVVAVLGATGVAGRLAVQNAIALGAGRVIAVGRDGAALTTVAGFGDVVSTVGLKGAPDADADALAAAFGEHRPVLVLDFVWGEPAEAAFAALSRSGMAPDPTSTKNAAIEYVEIGQAAGPTAALPAALLRSTPITVHGSGAGSQSMAKVMAEIPGYLDRIADGAVRVEVAAFPLDDVDNAWQTSTPGRRVVITPPRN